jgi:hypothetical protein
VIAFAWFAFAAERSDEIEYGLIEGFVSHFFFATQSPFGIGWDQILGEAVILSCSFVTAIINRHISNTSFGIQATWAHARPAKPSCQGRSGDYSSAWVLNSCSCS